jgi:hypothetical protein
MTEEITMWIMGLGPVLVHKQFVLDIGRRTVRWYLNGYPIPLEIRPAIQRLYEDCGNKYFLFSKYINQTLGNLMCDHVRRMHWRQHVIQVPNSYIISATSGTTNQIKATITFKLYDVTMKDCGSMDVMSIFNIDKNETIIIIN